MWCVSFLCPSFSFIWCFFFVQGIWSLCNHETLEMFGEPLVVSVLNAIPGPTPSDRVSREVITHLVPSFSYVLEPMP